MDGPRIASFPISGQVTVPLNICLRNRDSIRYMDEIGAGLTSLSIGEAPTFETGWKSCSVSYGSFE